MEKTPDTRDGNQVIFFAAQIAGASQDRDATMVAEEKGWIDSAGRLTPSGLELLRAFRAQAHTRSVFRPMC
jgi:hypothetical protein